MKKVVLLGTFDTKGHEYQFLKEVIESQGVKTLLVDAGTNSPLIKADVSNEEVAKAEGVNLADLQASKDRGASVQKMMKGAKKVVTKLYDEGKVSGIIALGGSGGTSIATYVMQALPVGVPKIMVSTVAAGNVSPYVGVKDIMMLYSIVDVSGLNNILKDILTNAGLAIAGIVKNRKEHKDEASKPLIAATMFGVTTPCITKAREYLESKGYEVVVFHATGAGGKSMESLIASGYFQGVLDITTTEWCDELVGGVLSAGPTRLDAAALHQIPQVVSVGALDMVNFGPMDTVPKEFKDRNLYVHNATVTLMRTTVEENRKLGQILAEKLNQSAKGKTIVMLPLKGVSAIDAPNMPFYGPKEDEVLFHEIRTNLKDNVILEEYDLNINDDEFAIKAADNLIKLMNQK